MRQYVMCTVCRSQRLSSLSSTVPSPRTRSASSSQVAKLIKVSADLRTERGAYYVSLGGFDTHKDNGPQLEKLFGDMNAALKAFVDEIKSQGRWDDVLVVSVSDFGRTITSNGLGTDHGWGGNHFVLGGSVNGGKIHGSYPDDLTPESPLNSGRGRRPRRGRGCGGPSASGSEWSQRR